LGPLCWVGLDFAMQRFYLRERDVPLDRARLEIWYQGRGFREVAIDTATVVREDGKVEVRFTIDEGTPVRAESIDFIGTEDLSYPELLDDLPLRAGDRLSVLALDATRDTLERRLSNRGYARAEVLRGSLIPPDDPYRARVTFDVEPGPQARYGHVEVSGNERLSESTILRTLQFRSGDVYRRDQILEAQGRLFGLEILRSASVEPDFVTGPDSVIPVNVRVQEGDAYRFRYGAGWSNAECLNVESLWAARNFLGGGRLLQVRGRMGNLLAPEFNDILCRQSGDGEFAKLTWLASVDLAQPWLFSTRNSLSASLFAERQSLPGIFIREAVGLQLGITRAIGPQSPLTISYRPELSRLNAAEVLFCTGFLVCAPEDIAILEGANWLAPVGINFTRHMANNLLNPTRGYTLVIDLEHAAAWTGSNFRYDRLVAEGTWYAEVATSSVFATRLRAGWVGAGAFQELILSRDDVEVVHPQKRFYAGGANSVRGFPQSRLGPRVLTTDPVALLSQSEDGAGCFPEELLDLSCDAGLLPEGRIVPRPTGGTRVIEGNVEVRFGLGSAWEGVTFADFGQVWSSTRSVSLRDLEVTPGLGVRFFSPIGPIRVDLGYRFRGGENLSVVTSQIRPFDPSVDDPLDRLSVNGARIDFVRSEELAVLTPTVFFGDSGRFSFSRLQLHISIGQAF